MSIREDRETKEKNEAWFKARSGIFTLSEYDDKKALERLRILIDDMLR